MDEYRPSFRSSGDFRMDVVSGRSSDLPPQAVAPRRSEAQTSSMPWSFNDPETKRRKRIAKYKVYTIEGRVKASIRNGIRWIKNKCSEIIHGY